MAYKQLTLGGDPLIAGSVPAFIHTWENEETKLAIVWLNPDGQGQRRTSAFAHLESARALLSSKLGWQNGTYELAAEAGSDYESVVWKTSHEAGKAPFDAWTETVSASDMLDRIRVFEPDFEYGPDFEHGPDLGQEL